MIFNARKIEALGIGFGPTALATLGLLPLAQAAQPAAGGGSWSSRRKKHDRKRDEESLFLTGSL